MRGFMNVVRDGEVTPEYRWDSSAACIHRLRMLHTYKPHQNDREREKKNTEQTSEKAQVTLRST